MNINDSHEVKQWQLIALRVAREAEEFASAALFDLGTTGIITLAEDADSLELGAYFDQRADAELIAQLLDTEFTRAGLRGSLFGVSISAIPEQDWMQKWKEGFAPIAIGQGSISRGEEKKILKQATATPATMKSPHRGTALPTGSTGKETPRSASPSSSPVEIATTTSTA